MHGMKMGHLGKGWMISLNLQQKKTGGKHENGSSLR